MKLVWIVLLALCALLVAFFGLWSIAVPILHRRAISRLFLEPGMRVADVGCGPGLVTVPLARRVGPAGEVVAYDITVLGEMTDPAAALAEIFQALKPSGILSVTESRPDLHFHSQANVRRLVEAVGFKQQAVFGNAIAFTMNFVKPGSEVTS